MNLSKIERGVELILNGLGVDLGDRNYIDTPERYARFIADMFTPKEHEWATFPEEYNDFILLKGHRVFSLCPHHLIPVEYTINVAYVPNGSVLGLSKLARVVDECNTGPILQEKLTKDIVEKIQAICPGLLGAASLVEGLHGCTRIRGIKSDAKFTTYKLTGLFQSDPSYEERFFDLSRR